MHIELKYNIVLICSIFVLAASMACAEKQGENLPPGKWKIVFEDEFIELNKDLDKAWKFQNGPSGHILSSRWRENAVLQGGIMKLQAKKDERKAKPADQKNKKKQKKWSWESIY